MQVGDGGNVEFIYKQGMKPEFAPIDSGLWQWRDWFIALANDSFWLLTPTPREFGPFVALDEAMAMVDQLVL